MGLLLFYLLVNCWNLKDLDNCSSFLVLVVVVVVVVLVFIFGIFWVVRVVFLDRLIGVLFCKIKV